MENEQLKKIVSRIDSLPTLPNTYLRISDLIKNSNTSAVDIADVILDDQVLTARLLKLVNSAFYGFSGKIKTVSAAVIVLGFRSLKELVLGCSVLDLFKEKEANPYFDLIAFWKHSLSVAAGCQTLAKYLNYDDPEELFVAGLLHDIGKLIENQYLRAGFIQSLHWAREKHRPIHEAELTIQGFSHCEIGLYLAEKWKLPDNLKEIVSFHHTPEQAKRYLRMVSLVHFADILTHSLELGNSGNPVVPALSKVAWDSLNFSASLIEPVMEKLVIHAEETSQLFNPMISS
jgi:putative nucleotidyltransferase with HDIG domain